MRTFKGNATRDTNKGKISYYGFRHPLVEHSFGKYMLKHQKQADGKLRSPDNWWSGWDESVSLDSMTRHLADLECIQAGLYVYKIRNKDEEITAVYPCKQNKKGWEEVSKEDCYNAIKFNCNAGLLEYLKRSV